MGMRALALALLVAACSPAKEPKHVSFRMVGSPPNATVTIDDIFVGRLETVQKRGVALPVGPHHLTVEAPGYFPFDQKIDAAEGSPIRVEVRLVAVPD